MHMDRVYCKVYRHLANKAAASSKYCQSIQVPWQLITFSLIRLLILASVCASSLILFECFPGLSMYRLVGNVWVFFVSGAFVIFGTMSFPVSQTHPAEIVFTVITLHVIAAPILLNTNVTFR